MDSRLISLLYLMILIIHIIVFRKLIFSWNALGVFIISNVIFSTIGILLFPWIFNFISSTFYVFDLSKITNDEVIKTQTIAIIGLLIVIYAYVFTSFVLTSRIKSYDLLSPSKNLKSGFSSYNLIYLTLFYKH